MFAIKLLSSLFLLISLNSFAQNIEVIFAKGSVSIKNKSGEFRKLETGVRGEKLIVSDSIVTGDDGFVIFKIDKISTHKIEENSEIEITKVADEAKIDSSQASVITLVRGMILSEVQKKTDKDTFQIKSKNLTFGVRGTRFLVDKDQTSDYLLTVNEGVVEVEDQVTKKIDYLEKDESIEILKGRDFQARQKFAFAKNIDWNVRSEKRSKRFKDLRSKIRSELRLKRKKWMQDSDRTKKFKERFKLKREKRVSAKEKFKDLKTQKRNKFIENKNQNMRERFKARQRKKSPKN